MVVLKFHLSRCNVRGRIFLVWHAEYWNLLITLNQAISFLKTLYFYGNTNLMDIIEVCCMFKCGINNLYSKYWWCLADTPMWERWIVFVLAIMGCYWFIVVFFSGSVHWKKSRHKCPFLSSPAIGNDIIKILKLNLRNSVQICFL